MGFVVRYEVKGRNRWISCPAVVQKTASTTIILVFLVIFSLTPPPSVSRGFQVGPEETLSKVKCSSRASILSFPAETKDTLIKGFYEDLALLEIKPNNSSEEFISNCYLA